MIIGAVQRLRTDHNDDNDRDSGRRRDGGENGGEDANGGREGNGGRERNGEAETKTAEDGNEVGETTPTLSEETIRFVKRLQVREKLDLPFFDNGRWFDILTD